VLTSRVLTALVTGHPLPGFPGLYATILPRFLFLSPPQLDQLLGLSTHSLGAPYNYNRLTVGTGTPASGGGPNGAEQLQDTAC